MATAITIVVAPIQAGTSRRWRSTSPLVARHGKAGAAAIRNRSASPIGVVIRSK